MYLSPDESIGSGNDGANSDHQTRELGTSSPLNLSFDDKITDGEVAHVLAATFLHLSRGQQRLAHHRQRRQPTSELVAATIGCLEAELNVNARLEGELDSAGAWLRRSAGAASDAKGRITEGAAGMGLTTHPPDGIPVQLCAALCLFTFLIAWFFF